MQAAGKQISVGILGAGFAGLRCADLLLQHGCKVTIFEARNRLGGRVAQSNHLGHLVDLGPNWIHGTENNPILRIAKETGTLLHAWDENSVIFGPGGDALDAFETDEYSSLLWDDGLIASAFRYSNEHHAAIGPERSLHDFFVQKAERLFLDQPEDVARRKRETLLQVASMWGAYIGSSVTRQSLKFFWMEECIQGENPFVAGTYEKILEAVAKPAVDWAEIKLNSEVVRIVSDDGSTTPGLVRARPVIHLADGAMEEFDEVVVTAPLGWLKRNKEAFRPALPARLSQAICNIGYGTLDKVYITFPSAFWDSPIDAPHSKCTTNGGTDAQGATPNVTATVTPLHQPPPEKTPQHYASFMHWLAPAYAPTTNPERWDPQGINLAALPPASAHPTILFYIYGACSSHIASLISSTSDPQIRDARLLEFFEPYYSRLLHYSDSNPACTPTGVVATAWASDKLAGYGSYSNFQVGLEEGGRDVEVMREGMPERGVWIAGEHTAPFVALGTSTGAWWSGEGVARRILRARGMSKEDQT
ncbi:hypothetical protein B0A54_16543 [Friedmanniomyces endolithicus]|uniref:Amine oxidase domain-containing protein n=1 Tax=Friedmanniomyces endolithicus TaxID=329885 RepID=A0A4U0TW60_9PEZI|nr:hypothetical protein LTS09_017008 [Friedmanniomyces endolithicus]TKA26558.1 hypothetical protein B0A54_16543 [Friedmanniomyces endolithicus]